MRTNALSVAADEEQVASWIYGYYSPKPCQPAYEAFQDAKAEALQMFQDKVKVLQELTLVDFLQCSATPGNSADWTGQHLIDALHPLAAKKMEPAVLTSVQEFNILKQKQLELFREFIAAVEAMSLTTMLCYEQLPVLNDDILHYVARLAKTSPNDVSVRTIYAKFVYTCAKFTEALTLEVKLLPGLCHVNDSRLPTTNSATMHIKYGPEVYFEYYHRAAIELLQQLLFYVQEDFKTHVHVLDPDNLFSNPKLRQDLHKMFAQLHFHVLP